MIFQNCLKFHSPNGLWNYVWQFRTITRAIYAKYHYKSCYYLYKLTKENEFDLVILSRPLVKKSISCCFQWLVQGLFILQFVEYIAGFSQLLPLQIRACCTSISGLFLTKTWICLKLTNNSNLMLMLQSWG